MSNNPFQDALWSRGFGSSRREFLGRMFHGFGGLALTGLLAREAKGAAAIVDPLAVKAP